MKHDYGFAPIMLGLIAVLAFAIPIFIGGMGIAFKVIKVINTPVLAGSVPIWAIFVGGIIFIWLFKKWTAPSY